MKKRSVFKRYIRLVGILVCLIASAASYALQNSATTGALAGVITDASSAVVSSATITTRSVTTNQTRTAISADDGHYRFAALPAGVYDVQIEVPGFAPYKNPGVNIPLGIEVSLDVTLRVEGDTQEVTVTDQPPALDTAATAATTTIDPERIEELPVNSRNYLEFTLLAPGVAPSNPQAGGSIQSQSGSPFAASGFTFGGLRPRSNLISIDGLDNTDATTGAARVALSPEIVREFQIVSNGISAESGGNGGGAVNVITKTGSNTFHGDAFLFGQNDAFNARDSFAANAAPGRPLFHRYQSGLAIGGPVRRDRLFFYTAGEQEHSLTEEASDIAGSIRDRVNSALASGFLPNVSVRSLLTGRFRTGSDETEGAGKLTYVGGNHTFNSRFAYTNLRSRGDAFNTEEFNDVSSRGRAYTKDYQLTGSDLMVLSSRLINEFRIQGSTRYATSYGGDRTGPEVDIVGLARFGRPFEGDTSRRENRLQLVDELTLDLGKHEVKSGLAGNHVSLSSEMRDGFGGLILFRTVDDFIAGNAGEWRQAFGASATDFGITAFGGFVQDRYRPVRTLTLNYGLRYDVELLPQLFRTNYSNLNPRLGIAWNPSAGWVFRGGTGLYYDRIPLAFLNRAIQKDGFHAYEQIAENAAAASIVLAKGGRPASPVPNIASSVFRPDPAFLTPLSTQVNAGVERLVSKDVIVRADYLFTRGIHLLRTRNVNLFPPLQGADGRAVFTPERMNPQFDAIYRLESSSASSYNGLTLSLNKRLSDEFELMASYTLSKTIDDASDFDEQPQNPYNLHAERGLSRQDVRNRFVVNSLFDLPIGEDEEDRGKSHSPPNLAGRIFGHMEAAPIFTFSSGRPVDAITGADEEGSRAWPLASRPARFGRNTFQTAHVVNMDFRLVKYIPYGEVRRLDFTAEAFNMFNHPQVLTLNPFYGSGASPLPSFASTSSLATPRQLRFSIDFEF